MTLSFQQIRQNYSNPVSAKEVQFLRSCNDKYCVGGAFILAAHDAGYSNLPTQPNGEEYIRFPNVAELGSAFHNILGLPLPEADSAAAAITCENDDGHFDSAWEILEDVIHRSQS